MITQDRALDAILQHLARESGRRSLIAPLGTRDGRHPWQGRCHKKPWDYRITAALPHLNTPEPLPTVIDLLRRQTIRPYILIIDTGSDDDLCKKLEHLRADDVEIHYLKSHAYLHPSAPVTAAMDVAFALCQTAYLFATHTDVFLRRQDLLETLLLKNQAVVGYEMSPRPGTNAWKGVVSHTATLFDMRLMRYHGITWNLLRYFERGHPRKEVPGWPDTESGLAICLKEADLAPLFIGRDQNLIRHTDHHIDHCRSYTGAKLYCAGTQLEETAHHQMQTALIEAQQRIEDWDRGY
jgi:hypothetical protein